MVPLALGDAGTVSATQLVRAVEFSTIRLEWQYPSIPDYERGVDELVTNWKKRCSIRRMNVTRPHLASAPSSPSLVPASRAGGAGSSSRSLSTWYARTDAIILLNGTQETAAAQSVAKETDEGWA